ERAAGRLHPRQAVVQALGPQSENLSPLKAYPADRLAAVVEATAADLHWIQLGSSNDPRVPGVRDLRGRTTAAESAGLLAHSQLFLGPPGFLMHLARAVDCRSVIIFGGRELPRHGGYQCNENLFSPQSCAPCYRRSTCLLQLECLTVISPSSVVDAVRRTAALRGKPIAVETAIVPPAATPFPLPWLPPIPAAI
ncbi:MAG: glycosyltransferase family 9 protein, partial [Verrucomicrobia bacterium]|nr:glycosyltransferase family 9 protein [Verrucomicrobiota bacterium]